ncbi:MAG: zinc metallopeptidase [Hyphomicrobiales bacterium]
MLYLIIIAVLLVLIFGPQIWVRHVISHHQAHREDLPGTGGELARHLLDEMDLQQVKVEATTAGGDHYDPNDKTVRLSPEHMDGKSLSAVAIAAHEVGHAMQDAGQYGPLQWRQRVVSFAQKFEPIGGVIMMAAPVVALVVRSPHVMALQIGVGLCVIGVSVAAHLVTLPVEFDASFKRALPVLQKGQYLQDKDLGKARHVLKAAAMTYVAAALMSLLNVARWIRYIRF